MSQPRGASDENAIVPVGRSSSAPMLGHAAPSKPQAHTSPVMMEDGLIRSSLSVHRIVTIKARGPNPDRPIVPRAVHVNACLSLRGSLERLCEFAVVHRRGAEPASRHQGIAGDVTHAHPAEALVKARGISAGDGVENQERLATFPRGGLRGPQ